MNRQPSREVNLITDDERDEAEDQGDEAGQQVQLAELLRLLDEAPDGLLSRGQFSLYKLAAGQGGGLLLSYHVDGQDQDMHLPIPEKLISLAVSAATGKGPFGLLTRML